MRRILTASAVAIAVAGCSASNPLIPDETVYISSTVTYPLQNVVFVAAIAGTTWLVVDPLAPNWKIETTKLDDTRYRVALTMKKFSTGGDGEAEQIFRRQAADIARVAGYDGYTVLSYTEGIHSQVLVSQRTAEGTVALRNTQAQSDAQ